jgi:hypothetical protein
MCFSLAMLAHLLIWCVIIGAIIMIIRVVVPLAAGVLGGVLVQIINIVLWAVVVILIIIFAFEMIGCLMGMAGGEHVLPFGR